MYLCFIIPVNKQNEDQVSIYKTKFDFWGVMVSFPMMTSRTASQRVSQTLLSLPGCSLQTCSTHSLKPCTWSLTFAKGYIKSIFLEEKSKRRTKYKLHNTPSSVCHEAGLAVNSRTQVLDLLPSHSHFFTTPRHRSEPNRAFLTPSNSGWISLFYSLSGMQPFKKKKKKGKIRACHLYDCLIGERFFLWVIIFICYAS